MHRIKYVGHFEIGFFSSCNGPINIRNVLMENNRGTKLGRGAKMSSIHMGSCTFNMCVCHFISAFEATWKISQLTLLLLADALIYSQSIPLLSEDVRVCGWRVVRRGTANIRQYPQQWPSCSCPGPAGRWKMQLEQSIAVRQTAEKEERSFAGFCGHQLQMCGGGQVEHRAAVLQCCSHTRLPTRGHRGAVFYNANV